MSIPKHPRRPAGFKKKAHQFFREAVGEASAVPVQAEPEPDLPKNPNAVELGVARRLQGGRARAAKSLTRSAEPSSLRAFPLPKGFGTSEPRCRNTPAQL